MVEVVVMDELLEVTDEQFDALQDLYVKCESCGGYREGRTPDAGEYMCEHCIG